MIYSDYSSYMVNHMLAENPEPEAQEYEFLRKYLDSCEQPFLELACGTGRVLLHLLEQGYSVVGTDSSDKMVDACRSLAEQRGLEPRLHQQFMQELSLDESFGLIFIDDSTLSLVVEDKDIHDLFGRVYEHLKPGGTFLAEFYRTRAVPPAQPSETWTGWVTDSEGDVYVSRHMSNYDFETRRSEALQVHDRYVDGSFVGSQAFEVHTREYDPGFLTEILTSKGFVDIRVMGQHTEEAPKDGDDTVAVACTRPR